MKPRNQILDVWRGVAILLVLGRHYDYFRFWQSIGWAGVDLFFVLSGFLISGLLFSEYKRFGNISVKRFWLRRAFKIYPAFYCMIAFTVGLLLLTGQSVPKQLLHDCFFLQNYLPPFWGTWLVFGRGRTFLLCIAIIVSGSREVQQEKCQSLPIHTRDLSSASGCVSFASHSHCSYWRVLSVFGIPDPLADRFFVFWCDTFLLQTF
jgi:fucose 4-O-acetylase-like acetyltransferase